MRVPATTADLLATIVAATRRIVEVREQREPLPVLAARADMHAPSPGQFRASLAPASGPRIIAECKRRSPLRGVLRSAYDLVSIAGSLERAGAAAISVLTEPTFFDGALGHLRTVRDAVGIPVLRKDFIVSEYQLHEARAAGADAVLLIVAALDPQALEALHKRALGLGLDVLVEVHGAEELCVAIDTGATIIGVNNRNLRTLEVDVRASEALVKRIPQGVVCVSESGLKTPDDLQHLRQLGYGAFLIGEWFMTEDDPGAELKALLQRCSMAEDPKHVSRYGVPGC